MGTLPWPIATHIRPSHADATIIYCRLAHTARRRLQSAQEIGLSGRPLSFSACRACERHSRFTIACYTVHVLCVVESGCLEDSSVGESVPRPFIFGPRLK